ncbi:transposase IS481 family protein [Kribbella pratensis]|uniref:Transposase IS481 family protein n=1 Tax=Kribbella pratensis TaxID=2512112 RepID=A0A4R8C420_9ACTN|nr:transposase IS481 family protein [Kribbella pratensis]
MSHVNATLTPRTRLRLARLVVEEGWTCAAAAKMFMVAPRTARKWAERYRLEGPPGMADRSSRPRRSPAKRRLRWYDGSCVCGGGFGSAPCRSPAGSVYRPRPCTPYSSAAGPGTTPAPNSASHPKDPALPAANQRQDREIPPHSGRRLGLRPLLHLRNPTPNSPARLAPLLQSPPTPQRHRRPTTHHPTNQRPWTSQLGAARLEWRGNDRCHDIADGFGDRRQLANLVRPRNE